MCGAVGGGDEAKKKEDEVGYTEQLGQLFVDDLFPERHLLLRIPSEPVPTNDILHGHRNNSFKMCSSLSMPCLGQSTKYVQRLNEQKTS